MHHRALTTTVALAVVAALALSGCTAEDTDAATDAVAPLDARTPLSPYLDAMYGVYDARDEILKREKIEESMASCMAEEGFDYIPVTQSPDDTVGSYEEGYGSAAWVAEHGYGAFPTAEETREIDAQIAAEDPNPDYIAGLSTGEQNAYYLALDGPAMRSGKEGEPVYDWTTAGCRGSAEHEVAGDDPTRSERYAPLVAAMNALDQDQLSDPAMAPIEAEWSACMADSGYGDLTSRQSAVDAVFAQSTKYWDGGATDEPDDALMAEWRGYEIAIATADFACAETVDYAAKELAVQADRENGFIDDNKAELDDMMAELAQG